MTDTRMRDAVLDITQLIPREPLTCINAATVTKRVLARFGVDAEVRLVGLVARVGPGPKDIMAYTNYDGRGFAEDGVLYGHAVVTVGDDLLIDASLPALIDDLRYLRKQDSVEYGQNFSVSFAPYWGPFAPKFTTDIRRIRHLTPGDFVLTPFDGEETADTFLTSARLEWIDAVMWALEPKIREHTREFA